MIVAMLLAHLVGDYVLQWDRLAYKKMHEFRAVLLHSFIIFVVTWSFAMPFDPMWWEGVLFISLTHFAIDAFQQQVKVTIAPLVRYLVDQVLHLAIIFMALAWGGYLEFGSLLADVNTSLQSNPMLTYLLGYAFITMPTWVLVKFIAYALVQGSGPNFPEGTNKYMGIVERIMIMTTALWGQFVFIPLLAIPRLVMEWPQLDGRARRSVYLVESLAGISLAVFVGLALYGL